MYYTYVLRSLKDGRFYKGLTKDIERRINEHNSGKTKSTAPYIPRELVYYEKSDNLHDARKKEKYLKSGAGRAFIKSLF